MKTTKRRKVWVTFFDDGEHFAFDTCREAKSYAGPFGSERQAVAMVELRKGEAIVDVESSREDAIAEGRRLERAAIVADLRRKAVTVANIRARVGMVALSATTERTFEALADLYERGEHEEGK